MCWRFSVALALAILLPLIPEARAQTATPTLTATSTRTQTATHTPDPKQQQQEDRETRTPTRTPTITPTLVPTSTPGPGTPTRTFTLTPTRTPTILTPTPTTPVPSPTRTNTPSPTFTRTPTRTWTITPTFGLQATATFTATGPSATPTDTFTPFPTGSLVPSFTPKPQPWPTIPIGDKIPRPYLDFPVFVGGTPVPDRDNIGIDLWGVNCVPNLLTHEGRTEKRLLCTFSGTPPPTSTFGDTPTETPTVTPTFTATNTFTPQPTPTPRPLRLPHTWAVAGEVLAGINGDALGYVMPFFVPVPAGQYARIAAASYVLGGGTTAIVTLQRNGSTVSGYSGIAVTTIAGNTDAADVALADQDELKLVVDGILGTPRNLSFTVFIAYGWQ